MTSRDLPPNVFAEARRRKQWTQKQLAEAAAVDQSTVSRLEGGRTVPPGKRDAVARVLQLGGAAGADYARSALRIGFPLNLWSAPLLLMASLPPYRCRKWRLTCYPDPAAPREPYWYEDLPGPVRTAHANGPFLQEPGLQGLNLQAWEGVEIAPFGAGEILTLAANEAIDVAVGSPNRFHPGSYREVANLARVRGHLPAWLLFPEAHEVASAGEEVRAIVEEIGALRRDHGIAQPPITAILAKAIDRRAASAGRKAGAKAPSRFRLPVIYQQSTEAKRLVDRFRDSEFSSLVELAPLEPEWVGSWDALRRAWREHRVLLGFGTQPVQQRVQAILAREDPPPAKPLTSYALTVRDGSPLFLGRISYGLFVRQRPSARWEPGALQDLVAHIAQASAVLEQAVEEWHPGTQPPRELAAVAAMIGVPVADCVGNLQHLDFDTTYTIEYVNELVAGLPP